jgi:hypothetical protein
MVEKAVLQELVSKSCKIRMTHGLTGIIGETSAAFYAEDGYAQALSDLVGETGAIANPFRWVYHRALEHCRTAMGDFRKEQVVLAPKRGRLEIQCRELPEKFLLTLTTLQRECISRKLSGETHMPSRVYQNIRHILRRLKKWEAEQELTVHLPKLTIPDRYREVWHRVKELGQPHSLVAKDLGLNEALTRRIVWTVRLSLQQYAVRSTTEQTPFVRAATARVIKRKLCVERSDRKYRESHKEELRLKRHERWLREGR